ncbi:unnamed protein product [Nesidiocoris tenuis]|uniref:t-SNARE coiled-coil homology domain-containing protein n=1 Tax=Nesidiocoris tenuis TaxID=355587 RepID=A0A6H5GKN2_9HEMI|nr:unnamed protein product [Nesidiocoris tenuis]CAB0010834.1 unnamed protein product [Nesidiocoris tenuis]
MWEQRQRESLLEGRAALERTSESLRNSELIAVQTETIGTNTLVRAQNRLADIDSNLSKSRQLLNFMKRSVFMNKILLIFVIVCEIGILACLVYLKYLR